MTNFTIFMNTFLTICGGIGIIGAAGAVIFRVIKPALALQEKVNELDAKCNDLKSDLESITKNTQILLTCTIALLNNNIAPTQDKCNLVKIQEQLNQFLVKK